MNIRQLVCATQGRLAELRQTYKVDLTEEILGRQLVLYEGAGAGLISKIKSLNEPGLEVYTNDATTALILYARQLKAWPAALKQILPQLDQIPIKPRKQSWTLRGKQLDFGGHPCVMGILNVTPDSFSDGGRYLEVTQAVDRALRMVDEGADIIDIGGESTRPGAQKVALQEELERVVPVVRELRSQSSVFISVDTYKSAVAQAALEAGADIVNDISGATFDPAMPETVARFNAPLVVMHIQGTPASMQQNPFYDDVVFEIADYFKNRIETLKRFGVKHIALDPGIGFGKRHEDNMRLLRDLQDFSLLGFPVLMGLSRKSFIGRQLQLEVEQRDWATAAGNIWSFDQGADIIRVHNVAATRQALDMYMAIADF